MDFAATGEQRSTFQEIVERPTLWDPHGSDQLNLKILFLRDIVSVKEAMGLDLTNQVNLVGQN